MSNLVFASKCVACIVLYNPKIERLLKNINAIRNQVDVIYCYDNASQNIAEIENSIVSYSNCTLIKSKSNIGIASAINTVCNIAREQGYDWILTLDQDSICPENMILTFEKYVDEDRVGIICPQYIDTRRPNEINRDDESVIDIDFCITSGSLMNIEVFTKVGGMDDYLFIGLVDDEYCYRLVQRDYRIIQINSIHMDHELGVLTPSKYSYFYMRLGNLLHSNKIKALSYKREVSSVRVYYATRNIIYLSKKYRPHPYKFSIRFAILNGISCIVRGANKIEILKEFSKGLIDGLNSKNIEMNIHSRKLGH